MNKDEILNLQPGRAMDHLIAEKIMQVAPAQMKDKLIPHYSTRSQDVLLLNEAMHRMPAAVYDQYRRLLLELNAQQAEFPHEADPVKVANMCRAALLAIETGSSQQQQDYA